MIVYDFAMRQLFFRFLFRSTLLGILFALLPYGCSENAKKKSSGNKTVNLKTKKKRPKLYIIDSHVHIRPDPYSMTTALKLFKEVGVKKFAVKSAGNPGDLRYPKTLRYAQALGAKMAFFTNLDWDGIDDPKWADREVKKIEQAMRDGASGIKIFKALGLGVRTKDDKLLKVDDPRLDPIFKRCGELGAIVAWHVADPVAFFEPITKDNERYEELSMAPNWSFHGKDYPSHKELLAARDRVIAKFPKTIFLGIHLANHPEDIQYVASILDRFPNLYVDISARIPEIGRHPLPTLKEFFTKYKKRILFGTDFIITPRGMQLGSVWKEGLPTYKDAVKYYADHRKFFETDLKNINHPTPIQGNWKINAINLPNDVLEYIYTKNAQRLIFDKRERYVKEHPKK